MNDMTPDTTRDAVRARYGEIARTSGSCCGPAPAGSSACCTPNAPAAGPSSLGLGYTESDLASVPEGADLALGCGNPHGIAAIKPGDVVLDLGSGPGFDCFLAARQTGPSGHVIGVDMTPDMIARARANMASFDLGNVEFRLGEIEHLPVADGTVDVILSNCVVNLSPDKPAVFREAFRVLKPGGRVAIADIVATTPLPEAARRDLAAYTGCVSGAALVSDLEAMLREAGFVDVRIRPKDESRVMIREWVEGSTLSDHVLSATLEGRKP